jgi:hypothetical protein
MDLEHDVVGGVQSRLTGSLLCRKDQTMTLKRHTEEQIIAIPKEHGGGVKPPNLCCKRGDSNVSFHSWNAQRCMP